MAANATFLKDIPLFQTMDDTERAAVAALMDEAQFRAGQQLFHERDQGGICYVIRSGRVELSVEDEGRRKTVVDILDPGELCGELSLLDGGTRSNTAVALTDVEVLALERSDLVAFLRRQPDASLDVLAALVKRIRRADAIIRQRVQDPNELIEKSATIGERIADAVAAFGGSWRFILTFLAFMLIWTAYNTFAQSWSHFDPYPFILLNLILSMLAALQAPVIMMSQNRQDAKDRIRNEADFRVNVKASVEIAELHEKLDRLRGELKLELGRIAKAAGTVAVVALAWCAAPAHAAERTVTLAVDATGAPKHVLHCKETIAVEPGPLALVYPKWTPGSHSPDGRIGDVVAIRVTAGGRALPWQRDEEDMYALHVEVPAGTRALDVAFDVLLPVPPGPDAPIAQSTAALAVLEWNEVVLYPKAAARDVAVRARLTLPQGWSFGSALEVARRAGDVVEFKPVTLEQLVDSPVLAGAHMKTVPLAPGTQPPHVIDLAADSAGALETKPELVAGWSKLVAEAGALFGARHYARYHFLLALADSVARGGLEHHQSSNNRFWERGLVDDDLRKLMAGLLPHEFVHSWCGKYRRPAGLATPDFQAPMRGDLLWVYEGLTTYWGWVLMARSGLATVELARDNLALMAAAMEHRPGRAWRPLLDTAVAAQVLYRSPPAFAGERRSVDFYPESALIWLEADALIRARSHGARSLDDFARRFFGGEDGAPEVRPYTRDEIVSTLQAIEPYDWRKFFFDRIDMVAPRAPFGGIAMSGYKVVYDATPNSLMQAGDKANKQQSLLFSIGVTLREDGTIVDAPDGLPAAQAGLSPGMKIIAVAGRKYNSKLWKDAMSAHSAIDVILENGDAIVNARIAYKAGEKYPHLTRDTATPDLLSTILAPRTK
jgi:predicted metalloprotease with PDZ domain/uncharacterized membrane protein